MTNLSDFQLVQGVLRGDPQFEEGLYRRFSRTMFRVCLRYAANRQEAEDLLQEGFMRVFADLRDYRGEGSLEGWIRRVIIRAALRALRQRRIFEQIDEQADSRLLAGADDAEDIQGVADDARQVTALFRQLPAGYRTVLNLFAIEGYSHDEIAGLLGISAGTSRSQLSKARAMLRKLLSATETTYPMQPEKMKQP